MLIRLLKLPFKAISLALIPEETTNIFEQLTIRAVNEDKISEQRGAELLSISYDDFDRMVHVQEA